MAKPSPKAAELARRLGHNPDKLFGSQTYYTSADQRVHSSAKDAVEGSLTFEGVSNSRGATGGCNQDSSKVAEPADKE